MGQSMLKLLSGGGIMSDIVNIIISILSLILWLLIIKKVIINKYSPVKIAGAIVVDKYKSSTLTKYPGISNKENCFIVFSTNNKKLSFKVSEFSYNNYKLNERGTLKYKGNRIISFE